MTEGSPHNGITEGKFTELLNDRVFVDYFNVFLSLPVFAQRIVFLLSYENFELDPQVNSDSRIVDKSRVVSWLYCHRLPLFTKTDLFAEYKLSRCFLRHTNKSEVSLSHFSPNSRKDETTTKLSIAADLNMRIKTAVSGAARMRGFRQYLVGTPGQRLYDLWMDIERFYRIPAEDERSRWLCYREIQITFYDFQTTLPTENENTATNCIMLDGKGFVECSVFCAVNTPCITRKQLIDYLRAGEQSDPDIVEMSSKPLRSIQKLLVRILHDYWLVKYVVHLKAVEWLRTTATKLSQSDGSDLCVESRQLEVIAKDVSSALSIVMGNKECPESSTVHLCSSIHIQSPKAALSSRVDVGSKTPRDIIKPCFTASSLQLPVTADVNSLVDDLEKGSSSASRQSVTRVSHSQVRTSSSTCRWPPEVCRVSSQLSTSSPCLAPDYGHNGQIRHLIAEQRLRADTRCTNSFRQEELRWHSVMDVRASRLSNSSLGPNALICSPRRDPNIFNSSPNLPTDRRSMCGDDTSSSRTSTIQSLGREWLPPICGNLPAEASCASLRHYHQRYRHENLAYVRAVLGDRLAGGPFENFLVQQDCIEASLILAFWHDAQVWLSCHSDAEDNVQSYVRCRRARALMLRYLNRNGDRQMCLFPPALRYSLQRHLAIGKGASLVRDAQDFAIEYLRPMWDEFCYQDRVQFTNVTSVCRAVRKVATVAKSSYPWLPSNVLSRREAPAVLTPRTAAKGQKLKPEEQLIHAARQRMEIALQLAVELAKFCLDGLQLEGCDMVELSADGVDGEYGSLTVPPVKVYRRPDLVLEELRQRRRQELLFQEYERNRISEEEKQLREDVASGKIPAYLKPIKGKDGKIILRPQRPVNFNDILASVPHHLYFKQFLAHHHSDTPWNFWMQIEDLRTNVTDYDKRRQKAWNIATKFLGRGANPLLEYDISLLKELMAMNPNSISPELLLAVQSMVAEAVDENWFFKYQDTFADTGENPYPLEINNVSNLAIVIMSGMKLNIAGDYLSKLSASKLSGETELEEDDDDIEGIDIGGFDDENDDDDDFDDDDWDGEWEVDAKGRRHKKKSSKKKGTKKGGDGKEGMQVQREKTAKAGKQGAGEKMSKKDKAALLAKEKQRKNKLYGSWMNFLKSVISLRRGLLNPTVMSDFLEFVRQQIAEELTAARLDQMENEEEEEVEKVDKEKPKVVGMRFMCGREVDLTKVASDIEFFAEVERYRMMMDEVRKKIVNGTFKPLDEKQIKTKSKFIIESFLDTPATPKVNLSPKLAREIVEAYRSNPIQRPMFHDAIVDIYAHVDHYWRSFVDFRRKRLDAAYDERMRSKQELENKKLLEMFGGDKQTAFRSGSKIDIREPHYFAKHRVPIDDDRTHLLFSLMHGLRLIIPRILPSAKDTGIFPSHPTLLPGVYYFFYNPPRQSKIVGSPPSPIKSTKKSSRRKKKDDSTGPVAGLFDRLQLKLKEAVMDEHEFMVQTKPGTSFPVYIINGLVYILNPEAEISVGRSKTRE